MGFNSGSFSGSGGGSGSSPSGTAIHNDLSGRSADDAHPVSAITGLPATVQRIDTLESTVGTLNAALLARLDGDI